MSAHHVKHATTCRARGSKELASCTCGAPGASAAQPASAQEAATVSAAERMDRRRAAREQVDANARRAAAWIEQDGAQRLDPGIRYVDYDLTGQLSKLFGRPLQVTRNDGGAYGCTRTVFRVYQRCAACCGDIRALASSDESDVALFAAIGVATRKSYLTHRCASVESSLLGFTYAELEALHAELERDGTAMIARAAEIAQLMKGERP